MKYREDVYYHTESDEVVNFKIKPKKIDEHYKYIHTNIFYRFWSWFSFYFLALPYAFLIFKLIKRVKFHNSKVLKNHKIGGYFIYANHSNQYCDGFCPALICFPKKPHIVVNADNVSIPFLGKLTRMWGALPLPNDIKATKNFYNSIELALDKNNPVLIYPETNLWPYYTKIRNFANVSFRYPIKYNKPVFTFTTVYKIKKDGKKPKVEIYVDGPFYPNSSLNNKEAQQQLRDEIYLKMNERSKMSNYEYVNYIKKEKTND